MSRYPDPNSIVDTLKSHGWRSDFNYRKELYEDIYSDEYHGSPEQNDKMNRQYQCWFGKAEWSDNNLK